MSYVVADITESIVILTPTQQPFVLEPDTESATIVVHQQGPPGVDGGSTLTAVAGEILGGHRIVRFDESGEAVYADASDVAQIGQVVGMTTGSASLGATANIWPGGRIEEPSWTWTPQQPVYLGSSGMITQTVPTSGVLQPLGYAIDATSLFFIIQTPVEL